MAQNLENEFLEKKRTNTDDVLNISFHNTKSPTSNDQPQATSENPVPTELKEPKIAVKDVKEEPKENPEEKVTESKDPDNSNQKTEQPVKHDTNDNFMSQFMSGMDKESDDLLKMIKGAIDEDPTQKAIAQKAINNTTESDLNKNVGDNSNPNNANTNNNSKFDIEAFEKEVEEKIAKENAQLENKDKKENPLVENPPYEPDMDDLRGRVEEKLEKIFERNLAGKSTTLIDPEKDKEKMVEEKKEEVKIDYEDELYEDLEDDYDEIDINEIMESGANIDFYFPKSYQPNFESPIFSIITILMDKYGFNKISDMLIKNDKAKRIQAAKKDYLNNNINDNVNEDMGFPNMNEMNIENKEEVKVDEEQKKDGNPNNANDLNLNQATMDIEQGQEQAQMQEQINNQEIPVEEQKIEENMNNNENNNNLLNQNAQNIQLPVNEEQPQNMEIENENQNLVDNNQINNQMVSDNNNILPQTEEKKEEVNQVQPEELQQQINNEIVQVQAQVVENKEEENKQLDEEAQKKLEEEQRMQFEMNEENLNAGMEMENAENMGGDDAQNQNPQPPTQENVQNDNNNQVQTELQNINDASQNYNILENSLLSQENVPLTEEELRIKKILSSLVNLSGFSNIVYFTLQYSKLLNKNEKLNSSQVDDEGFDDDDYVNKEDQYTNDLSDNEMNKLRKLENFAMNLVNKKKKTKKVEKIKKSTYVKKKEEREPEVFENKKNYYEKGGRVGMHYHTNEDDGNIYKYYCVQYNNDGTVGFKCTEPNCRSKALLDPRKKTFTIMSKHLLNFKQHKKLHGSYLRDRYIKFMIHKKIREVQLTKKNDKKIIEWYK
jgi:hypothetical protein